MNQRLFTFIEVLILGGLVVFVMLIGGAFKGPDPAPTFPPPPTATLALLKTAKPAPTLTATGDHPAAIVLPSPTATTPAITQPSGLIAFESTRDGDSEIYVMDLESGAQTNLTNNPAEDYAPLWSPDGSRIAFFSTRTGWLEILVMKADGSDVRQLTNTKGTNTVYGYPISWSSDGEQILAMRTSAWHVGKPIESGSLDLIQGDSSGVTTLYQDDELYLWQASWSPDGRYIATIANTSNGASQLYLGRAGETPFSLSRFTSSTCFNYIWSPDSKLICYADAALAIINPDGSDEKSIVSFTDSYPTNLTWSPNGKLLLYVAQVFGLSSSNEKIYVVNPDGSGRREIPITANLLEGSAPSWSPDGQWLAYNSKEDDLVNIHIVNVYDPIAHGQLTINAGDNFSPQWQP